MIRTKELRRVARERLRDARVLFRGRRFDGAYYLAGYAIEIALKARICRTCKWDGFPETGTEFHGMQSLKTHDLEILLKFSGAGPSVIGKHMAAWSTVLDWNPEKRYQHFGTASQQRAADMLEAAGKVVRVL
jgi:hypothetical protein